jgi:hypothetical protein
MQKPRNLPMMSTFLVPALLAATVAICAAAGDPSGQEIYQTKCQICHGPQGQGTAEHKRPLEGGKSVSQLAELIGTTMPEDDPGSLSAGEAGAVAFYIHDAFYSPIARERNRPARVELARLTIRQFRLALADLIGSFRPRVMWDGERGLRGQYYGGRRLGHKDPQAERLDSQVNFDFGAEAPVSEITEPHEFSIRWTGSVAAPDTGEYEFLIRTEHAARLWVNDDRHPLIDAWVKSGNDTEYRASLFLVGGRAYPLRLEFTKAKQGVDDSKDQKEKPPSRPASIALLWKRPHSVSEPVPSRQLCSTDVADSFVCATPFPADDRSYGWERGTAVSKAWDQATTAAAIEAAAYVAEHLNALTGTDEDAGDRLEKVREFCRSFAERAFRRPLGDDEVNSLIGKQFSSGGVESAVRRLAVLVLKSPRFLYREIGDGPEAFKVASRLSFGLWNSIPDQELWAAAAAGRLTTPEQVAHEAERMLDDPRAKAKLREFLLTWAKADPAGDLAKDPQRFPDFDAATVADLRTSLELFLNDVVWSEGSDFRRLLSADEVLLNARLAKFYGVALPAEAAEDFVKVKLDAGQRAGILTHPYLMAAFAHTGESSPIHRGLFLVRGLLGQALRPPPESVAPLAVELHPALSTRERVTMQTEPANCMTCHAIINPLGFTLEHFDAVGRFRELDRGKPVDATGTYQTRAGSTVTVNGTRELAEFLAGSEEAHAAFIEQLFHHLVQQSLRAYGPTTLDDLRRAFAADGFNIRKLAIRMMVASALVGREN